MRIRWRWLLVVALLSSQAIPAWAGWVPAKPVDDHFDTPAPLSSAALQKALADPDLAKAYHLLTGARSNRGVELTEKLASAGNPVAQTALCVVYGEGFHGPYDFDKAKPWCQRAALQGYAMGEFALGWLLQVSGQRAEGLHWHRLAAAQDLPFSYIALTRAYALGEGVAVDRGMAERLLAEGKIVAAREPLAAGGTASCGLIALSQAYRFGLGVTSNEVKANQYLWQAANGGCWFAQSEIAVRIAHQVDGFSPDDRIYYPLLDQQSVDGAIAAAYVQPLAAIISH